MDNYSIFSPSVFLFVQPPKTEGEGEAAATPATTEEPKPEGDSSITPIVDIFMTTLL